MVAAILDNLAARATVPKILQAYPSLCREDVRAAIAYTAEMACEHFVSAEETRAG